MRVYKKINNLNYGRLAAWLVLLGGTLFLGMAAHLSVSADEGQKITIVDSSNFRDYVSAYGHATIPATGDLITVTSQDSWRQGAVYFNERIDVSQPFSVKLTVNIIGGSIPADGMAFGFTESPIGEVGRAGEGFGIEGTKNSTVLIFDTYRNGTANEPAVPNVSVRYTKGDSTTEGFFDEEGNALGQYTPNTATSLTAIQSQVFAPFDLEMNYDPATRNITYTFLGHTIEASIGDRGIENGLAFVATASTGGAYSAHRLEIQEIQATLLTPDPESITIEQDASTGDVTIMPLEAGGATYPTGTLVNIEGVGTFPVDSNGVATIPKDQLAEYDASRPITIEETTKNPSNPTTEVVPGYRTSPPTDTTITKNSDDTGTIIPMKEDGSRYPENTVVTVPGVGDLILNSDGEATIPSENMPEYDEIRSITATEPGKDTSPTADVVVPGRTTVAPQPTDATKDETGNGIVHPTKPDGSSYPEGTTVEIVGVGEYLVDEDGNITIPENQLPTYDTDTSMIIREEGKEPSADVPVTVPGTTTIDPEGTTVTKNDNGSATIVPTKPGGGTYPAGTVVNIPDIGNVTLDENGAGTIPADDMPQYDTNAPATITEPDKAASGEFTIPIEGYQTTSPSTDSIAVEKNEDGSATVSATRPDGSLYPAGSVVGIPDIGYVVLDENGEGTIPAGSMPTYDTIAQATVTESGKDTSDPVNVFVPGYKTDEPGDITVDRNPDDSGTITVTKPGGSNYPAGTVANIQDIGGVILDENGQGTIPASQMPTYDSDVDVTVQEADKEASDSVNVPIEGSKTIAPAQILSEKNEDGTGTITPLKADGSPYADGTVVTLDGIGTITLDENGQGVVPADQMPEYDTPYSVAIEEAGKDSSDPVDVVLVGRTTTPPSNMAVNKNSDGSITISPQKLDGNSYPAGTVVSIPGIGDITLDGNGNGVIPADEAPLYDENVTATITEPDKESSEIELFLEGSKTEIPGVITTTKNPDGSVTLTVRKADGTNYPAGTIVSIPGIGDITLNENGEGVISLAALPQHDTDYNNATVTQPGRTPSINTELFLAGTGIAPSAPDTGYGPSSSFSLFGLVASIIGVVVCAALADRRKLRTS